MLNADTLNRIMTNLGGRIISEPDETFWLFQAGEVCGEVGPFFRKHKSGITVGIDVSVNHPELSRLANIIVAKKQGTRQQFNWHQSRDEINNQEEVIAALTHLVNREIEHLKSIHLQAIIDTFVRRYPSPESKSMEQILHLSALAYEGSVAQLTEYLEAMKLGKRFNFVPMITDRMIERALNLPREQQKKKRG